MSLPTSDKPDEILELGPSPSRASSPPPRMVQVPVKPVSGMTFSALYKVFLGRLMTNAALRESVSKNAEFCALFKDSDKEGVGVQAEFSPEATHVLVCFPFFRLASGFKDHPVTFYADKLEGSFETIIKTVASELVGLAQASNALSLVGEAGKFSVGTETLFAEGAVVNENDTHRYPLVRLSFRQILIKPGVLKYSTVEREEAEAGQPDDMTFEYAKASEGAFSGEGGAAASHPSPSASSTS